MSDAPPSDAESARRLLVHEMRNAIGAIRTATELLQRRYRPEGRDQRLFEVIFSERHLGRAAARLNLTASAVSHAQPRSRRPQPSMREHTK